MIWWFVTWILYGQRPFYQIRKFTMVLILEWCHSVLAEARGKEKATIGAVCKRCGRWWDPWLDFDPFVMVLTGGAVHECQPCLFHPEMWLHFGCANEAVKLTYSLWKRNSSLSWVQTVFLPGVVVGNVLLTDLPIYNHQKWTFFKDVFFPI